MRVERTLGMKRVQSTLWVAAILVTLWSLPVYAQEGEVSYAEGKSVFRAKGCSHCHAVFGRGGKGGPDLGERKFYGTYLELAARMWNHFPKMYKKMQKENVEFHKVDTKEMGQLMAYISFIRFRGEPGDEYKGQELLKDRCGPCHKFRGEGGDLGPEFDQSSGYMSSIRLVESMWNHGPDMMDVFREQNIKRPVFKGHDIEHMLAAMRSYISATRVPPEISFTGDPVRGEALFAEKGCVHCHAYRGEGGTLGPDFADVALDYSAVQIAGKMWNHAPGMWEIMEREDITIPEFKKGEMGDLVAYLYSLKLQDEPGNAERGYRLIDDKGCLACHSLRGKGSTISKDLTSLEGMESSLGMIAAMWNHAPGMQEKHKEKHKKWPKLGARDMADLYAYLSQATHESGSGE